MGQYGFIRVPSQTWAWQVFRSLPRLQRGQQLEVHFEDFEASQDREDIQRDQNPVDFVWRTKYSKAVRHFEGRYIEDTNFHLRVHAKHRKQSADSNIRG